MKKSELRQLIREILQNEGSLTNKYAFRVSGMITIGNGAANRQEAEDMAFEKLSGLIDNLELDFAVQGNLEENKITESQEFQNLEKQALDFAKKYGKIKIKI